MKLQWTTSSPPSCSAQTTDSGWKEGFKGGKGSDKAELRLRHAQRSGDPKLIAEAVKSYLGAEDLLTKKRGLEGAEIFGSPRRRGPQGSPTNTKLGASQNQSIGFKVGVWAYPSRKRSAWSQKLMVLHFRGFIVPKFCDNFAIWIQVSSSMYVLIPYQYDLFTLEFIVVYILTILS